MLFRSGPQSILKVCSLPPPSLLHYTLTFQSSVVVFGQNGIFGIEAPKGLSEMLEVFGNEYMGGLRIWRLPFVGKYLPNPGLRKIEEAQRFVYNLIDDLLKERSAKLLSGECVDDARRNCS